MPASLARALLFLDRVNSGLASRARNIRYKLMGVEIGGYAWLKSIEIPRNHGDIAIGRGAALDTGTVLLAVGETGGPKKIVIGENTYINRNTIIDAALRIEIGRDVAIGPGCYITDHDHGTTAGRLVLDQPLVCRPTVIGEGVWLGAGVIVLKGVTIGAGTVVAAGSLVTRDLPAGVIAKGRPAAASRHR